MDIHGENDAENLKIENLNLYLLWYNILHSPITNLYFNKKKIQTEINFSVTKYVVDAVSVKL